MPRVRRQRQDRRAGDRPRVREVLGLGQIWEKPIRHEHVPAQLGYWRRDRTFDELGRVITEIHWFEPVADAEKAPEAGGDAGGGGEPSGEKGPNGAPNIL